MQENKRRVICLATLCFTVVTCLLLLLTSPSQATSKDVLYVSEDFTKAIDAAFLEMADDDDFIDGYRNLGLIFPIPYSTNTFATTGYPYPKHFDFNYKEKVFTMCFQQQSGSPREELHILASKTLIRLLNKRYGIDLKYSIKQLDTAQKGYYNTLKEAVESGECHISSATTIIDDTRSAQVHFQWPYASSSYGFLRSGLDPNIKIQNIHDLNRTGLIIGIAAGSYFENFIPLISEATIVRDTGGTSGVLKLVNLKTVHAILADMADLIGWLRVSSNNCTTCFVRGFGSTTELASFTTINIIKSSNASYIMFSWITLLIFILCITKY
ncbi:hypothetical protein ABK040_010574 [Willaertia magna]